MMRTQTTRWLRLLGAAVLIGSAGVSAALVFFPDGWAINRLNVRVWSFLVYDLGLPSSISPGDMEFFWNIVMFTPLGLALCLITPSWWWLFALSCLSAAVEVVQFAVLGGRSADVWDWTANSLGGRTGSPRRGDPPQSLRPAR